MYGISKKEIKNEFFFAANLNYCIWLIHSRFNNRRVKNLHERCFPLQYSIRAFLYEEVMEKDVSVSVHYKNIQTLAVEKFIIKNGMSPAVVSDIFLP